MAQKRRALPKDLDPTKLDAAKAAVGEALAAIQGRKDTLEQQYNEAIGVLDAGATPAIEALFELTNHAQSNFVIGGEAMNFRKAAGEPRRYHVSKLPASL